MYTPPLLVDTPGNLSCQVLLFHLHSHSPLLEHLQCNLSYSLSDILLLQLQWRCVKSYIYCLI